MGMQVLTHSNSSIIDNENASDEIRKKEVGTQHFTFTSQKI